MLSKLIIKNIKADILSFICDYKYTIFNVPDCVGEIDTNIYYKLQISIEQFLFDRVYSNILNISFK